LLVDLNTTNKITLTATSGFSTNSIIVPTVDSNAAGFLLVSFFTSTSVTLAASLGVHGPAGYGRDDALSALIGPSER
jgi:hypothetical protein